VDVRLQHILEDKELEKSFSELFLDVDESDNAT
jgi:hypothetical protein